MDFTPHTEADVARMLATLDLEDPGDLFSHLPDEVIQPQIEHAPRRQAPA